MGPDLAGTRFKDLVWVEGLGFRVCEMGTLFWGYYLGYYIRVPYNQKPPDLVWLFEIGLFWALPHDLGCGFTALD